MEAPKPKGFGKFDSLMKKLVKVPAEKTPTPMKAGYDGGACEVCGEPIRVGDTYFFLRDEKATVACEKCARELKRKKK